MASVQVCYQGLQYLTPVVAERNWGNQSRRLKRVNYILAELWTDEYTSEEYCYAYRSAVWTIQKRAIEEHLTFEHQTEAQAFAMKAKVGLAGTKAALDRVTAGDVAACCQSEQSQVHALLAVGQTEYAPNHCGYRDQNCCYCPHELDRALKSAWKTAEHYADGSNLSSLVAVEALNGHASFDTESAA